MTRKISDLPQVTDPTDDDLLELEQDSDGEGRHVRIGDLPGGGNGLSIPESKIIAAGDLSRVRAWDTVNRANSSSPGDLDSGHSWVEQVGSWGVIGGMLEATSFASMPHTATAAALTVTLPSLRDFEISCVMGVDDNHGGLILAWIDDENYVYCHTRTTNDFRLVEVVDGVADEIGRTGTTFDQEETKIRWNASVSTRSSMPTSPRARVWIGHSPSHVIHAHLDEVFDGPDATVGITAPDGDPWRFNDFVVREGKVP